MYLIGFGASSMEGVGDSSGGFFRRLQIAIGPMRPELEFANLGIGGDTSREMLARAGEIAQYGAHDLILMLGCNDLPRDNDQAPHMRTALTEYESNVRALLRMVRGEYSLFISSFPVCVDRTGVRTDTLKAYMDVAISVARDFDYDVWDLFGELAGKNIDHYLADDGLHFNDQGHAMIAGEVQSKGDFVNALSLR